MINGVNFNFAGNFPPLLSGAGEPRWSRPARPAPVPYKDHPGTSAHKLSPPWWTGAGLCAWKLEAELKMMSNGLCCQWSALGNGNYQNCTYVIPELWHRLRFFHFANSFIRYTKEPWSRWWKIDRKLSVACVIASCWSSQTFFCWFTGKRNGLMSVRAVVPWKFSNGSQVSYKLTYYFFDLSDCLQAHVLTSWQSNWKFWEYHIVTC